MAARDGELIEGLLGSLEKKRDVREKFSLLVDTLHMLTGLSCSVFLISRRNNQVWWDYLKGPEFKGSALAAHQPYQLCLEEHAENLGWVAGENHLKLVHPLDQDNLILLRVKRRDEAGCMESVVDLVERALPAIEGLHRMEREERALQEEACVRHMSDTLLSVQDRDRALHLLAASISKCLSSERASVLGISPDGKTFTLKGVYGKVNRVGVSSRPIRLGDGVAGWSIANRMPANIADVRRDPRYIVTTCDDIMSMLVVPVCASGEPLGAICAVNKRSQEYEGIKPFPADDEALLTSVSLHVGGILSA
jgi:GAF domain-containing protein